MNTPVERPAAFLNAIGTALPRHEVHAAFLDWAGRRLATPRDRALFRRMAARSGITHRWSVIANGFAGSFYAGDTLPPTSTRMALYAEAAPALACDAARDLAARLPLDGVTHLVVASCTGFVAPGIDQLLAARLGLAPSVERTLVGFMGCYAAVAAVRLARHIVRSDPAARVLVVAVELSTLHLQDRTDAEALLAMLQFADGAAAALVSADPRGLELGDTFARTLPDSADLIRWTIGDTGFAMHLSGEVPQRISHALADLADPAIETWAIHPGGRSILDAAEAGLGLAPDALAASRAVLAECGNMSSATLLFVLARIMAGSPVRRGRALAFGPGLACEGFDFRGRA